MRERQDGGGVGEFVRRLRELKLRAGDPSLGELKRRTGIPVSTLSDALKPDRRRPPSVELVRAVVTACGGDDAAVAEFEDAWYALKRLEREPQEVPSAPHRVVPRQLPPVHGFSGRHDSLARLDEAAPSIAVITGTAGVGKTALALHWAHSRAGDFPDGQLFLDLHGHASAPALDPRRALSLLLQSLGVVGASVPVELELQTGLYRSLLAGRRLLLVLDNATDAEQVRPLLPGSPDCHVVVTSRNSLSGLVAREGARQVGLGVLAESEALALLTAQLGADRIAAEYEAAAELVTLCACLPLALRVAAALLAGRPGQSLAGFAAELRGANRLAKLQVVDDPDAAVVAAFDLSYAALHPAARRLFRLVGLVPGPEISRSAVAVLAGLPPDDPLPVLDQLAAAHLLDARGPDRFRCHELLRMYAWQCARHEMGAAERAAAMRRLQSWYLLTTDVMADLHNPGFLRLPRTECDLVGEPSRFADAAEAVAWLDDELPSLIALIGHSAQVGPRWLSWHLVDALRASFFVSRRDVEWVAGAQLALAAAEAEDDPLGIGAVCNSLGVAFSFRGDLPTAAAYYRRAVVSFEQAGYAIGRASAVNNVGDVLHLAGRLPEALRYFERSLAASNGSARPIIVILSNLAHVHRDLGNTAESLTFARRAVTEAEGGSGGAALSVALTELGLAECADDRPAEGMRHLQRAREVARQTRARRREIDAIGGLAAACSALGRHQEALTYARQVLELAPGRECLGLDTHTTVIAVQVLLAAGRPDEAAEQADSALASYGSGGYELAEARLLLLKGKALAGRGGVGVARECWRTAQQTALRIGAPVEAAEATLLLGGSGASASVG